MPRTSSWVPLPDPLAASSHVSGASHVATGGPSVIMPNPHGAAAVAPGRKVFEGKGPQRPPQQRLHRRLEVVAKAVGCGYCRLSMLLGLALAIRGTMAGRRVEARERGGGVPSPPSNATLCYHAKPPGGCGSGGPWGGGVWIWRDLTIWALWGSRTPQRLAGGTGGALPPGGPPRAVPLTGSSARRRIARRTARLTRGLPWDVGVHHRPRRLGPCAAPASGALGGCGGARPRCPPCTGHALHGFFAGPCALLSIIDRSRGTPWLMAIRIPRDALEGT